MLKAFFSRMPVSRFWPFSGTVHFVEAFQTFFVNFLPTTLRKFSFNFFGPRPIFSVHNFTVCLLVAQSITLHNESSVHEPVACD